MKNVGKGWTKIEHRENKANDSQERSKPQILQGKESGEDEYWAAPETDVFEPAVLLSPNSPHQVFIR